MHNYHIGSVFLPFSDVAGLRQLAIRKLSQRTPGGRDGDSLPRWKPEQLAETGEMHYFSENTELSISMKLRLIRVFARTSFVLRVSERCKQP